MNEAIESRFEQAAEGVSLDLKLTNGRAMGDTQERLDQCVEKSLLYSEWSGRLQRAT